MVKKTKFTIEKHNLIPKHSVCSDKEKQQVYEKYGTTDREMPKISSRDAALVKLKVKKGTLIKIERDDKFTGKTIFYRVVSDE
ncbi:MAG: DNA-directed RNA polymerase subunit RpoH/Rpb5 C-terminal domain-containing protein [Candidatus Woesearchaeota archaeon]